MKREELKFKTELRQMTRKSQDEYSSLPAKERAKLLEYVAESNPKKKGKKQVRPQPKENADGFSSSLDELPPPSPSVDLELRSTPGIETPYHATRVGDRGIQDSVNAGGRTEDLQSGITGRSTGTASIRAKVDLSVVMQGRGFANVDGDHSSTVLSREEQIKRKVLRKIIALWGDRRETVYISMIITPFVFLPRSAKGTDLCESRFGIFCGLVLNVDKRVTLNLDLGLPN